MLWKDGRRSENIEDERGTGRRVVGGGGKLGVGSIVAILAISYFTGQNPLQLLGMLQDSGLGGGQTEVVQVPQSAESNEQADFVSVVLASTEDTWGKVFNQYGKQYQQPKLKLFSGEVQSACGNAQSAMGPFYCPADQKVYIDLDFFQELENRMGAGGDFARAYVVGHEIGHHVQNLLGTSTKVHQARQQMSEAQGNQLSVKLELQADCYAGVWAHHAEAERQMLENGDIEEAMTAAAAVGDDQIMKSAGRAVNPEAFTHGSSKERMHWFQVGMREGDLNACNTFKS
jgi:uncharacterized protein